MKVILIEDVQGAGKKGDTVTVRDGYGRNFLVPRGLAIPATQGNVARFENIIRSVSKKKERDIQTAEELKARLQEVTLAIRKKAGEDGRLFGSVTNKDIAEAVKASTGVEIDKKLVRLEEPIKVTGEHTVVIHLQPEINAEVKIEVEKEEA
ncbi:MAG: 50S ribosomal protein L9 [Syntrophorhabdaceae bacterium]|nr:50S ribosomal protein L9 [Syntrophorhabdaceae bacterium]MDD4196891.1 50S ribosomal protein L9 [Syntrophorhabdaceae bacterium]HOC46916.1 50S ribosomal protein L9 [Syntrophorhabdaceae bacterium]